MSTSRWSRMRPLIQPAIIRTYKFAGVVALTLILVALITFVTVNIFYFFNRSWVRPVILTAEHSKVVDATTALADAKLRSSELTALALEARGEVEHIDRLLVSHSKYLDEVGAAATRPARTPDEALLRAKLDEVILEQARQGLRRQSLVQKAKDLDARLEEQKKIIERLATSPYIRATDQRITVAFVPYQNLRNLRPSTPLYGCTWGLVRCSEVGTVIKILDGEVQETHPHDNSVQRGVMVEISLQSPDAAEDRVLFAGHRPLWLF
jgi:hypothetical protein